MMKNIKVILILICVLSSCQRDEHNSRINENEKEVEMDVSAQNNFVGDPLAIDYETSIETLDLIVCDQSDNYLYRNVAWLSGNRYKSTLKIQDNITIYFVANIRSFLNSAPASLFNPGVSTWDDIFNGLIDSTPSRLIGGATSLPMWGRLQHVDIKEGQINNLNKYNSNNAIPLIRSVASVDVKMDVPEDVFELTEAFLYFPPDQGYLCINNDNYDPTAGDFGVVPTAPSGMKTIGSLTTNAVVDNAIMKKMYLYDNPYNVVSSTERHTRLILGGKYNKSTNKTYYPIDFIKEDGVTLHKLTRNYKYYIQITSVNSSGYETPDEAADAASVNMDYDIIDWNMQNDENMIIDGPEYLSVQKKSVVLQNTPLIAVTYTMSSSYSAEKLTLSLTKGTSVDLNTITGFENSLGIQNEKFRVEILCDPQGEISHIRFNALTEFDSAYFEDVLTITVGRIRFEIDIVQLGYDKNDWDEGEETIVE